ncbi:MAG: hypothetical protein NC936_06170 [Candidatus Omnitrophica bacterium]|nr:hypothetical protein [Candidatus Omnitrophota bacterium]
MRQYSVKALLIFILLLIIFIVHQSFRLKTTLRQNIELKARFNEAQLTNDILNKQLIEASNTVSLLKQENERISVLLEGLKAQREKDKEKARELKDKIEAMLQSVSP